MSEVFKQTPNGRRVSRGFWFGLGGAAVAIALVAPNASAPVAAAADQIKAVAEANPFRSRPDRPVNLDEFLKNQKKVVDQNPNLTPAQRAYDTLLGQTVTRVALKHRNFNPEVIKNVILVEGGWNAASSDGSGGGNLSGVKCIDDKERAGCGPLTRTLEDNGDGRGLVVEYHRFQTLPGNTLEEKITSNAERLSKLFREAPWFHDVEIASQEPDPQKSYEYTVLALQHKTDGHGNILAHQGEPGVKSYASLRNDEYGGYPGRLNSMRELTRSDEAFADYYELMAAESQL